MCAPFLLSSKTNISVFHISMNSGDVHCQKSENFLTPFNAWILRLSPDHEKRHFISISVLILIRHGQCISGKCRVYSGNDSFCAGDRVEAVTALDILYNDFHRRVYDLLKSSKNNRSCGMNYTCPDGEHICETR